ncbi:MAG: hypothetical protein ACEPO8_10925 [Rhodothermaceae bacterium]
MKLNNYGMIIVLLLTVFCGKQNAQDLLKDIIIAKTNYEIFYENQKLDIKDQGISKRGLYQEYKNLSYGLESYHLEISFTNNVQIDKDRDNVIELYSADDQLLASALVEEDFPIKRSEEWETKINYYSISLLNLPIFALKDAVKVVIRED